MNVKILQNRYIQLTPPIITFILLSTAIWDFLNDQQFIIPILIIYLTLLFFSIVILYIQIKKRPRANKAVKLFEQSLKGSLHHFKCPNCDSIFAIKKSKINNKKPFILYCPTCNTQGLITPKPIVIKEKIPQEKSPRTKYQCAICGERITMWSEGSMLQPTPQILSCPYCESNKPLNQLSA
jgi:DNA-directed RNA polymerase subunit RPC12/RpoP